MTSAAIDAHAAWPDGPEFPRFIADLLNDVVQRLRPGHHSLRTRFSLDSHHESDDSALDSLERFSLAVAIAEAVQFPRIAVPERLQQFHGLNAWVAEARRCCAGGAESVGFRSSGTSGTSHCVVHPVSTLAQEVSCLSAILRPGTRIITAVPAHHIYGFLFTVLLPQLAGVKVIDARGHTPLSVSAMVEPGDVIVAYPAWWQHLANLKWPADVTGVTSTAPCPAQLSASLRRNGLRLVEVYGSTETAGIGWRENDNAPYQLFPFWQKAQEDAVRRDGGDSARIFPLPDIVTWHDVRHLVPIERRDGAVQVGGINVHPELVRQCLLTCPGVAEAAVRLMRADEGERLKAFIVPKPEITSVALLHRALEIFVNANLDPMARPRAFTFGTAVPTSPMGKNADWMISPNGF